MKLNLHLDEVDVRDLAQLLESRHGTADPLVGKLKKFTDQRETMGKPLDVTFGDIQTLKGMIAEEPFLAEPAFRRLPDEIDKALPTEAKWSTTVRRCLIISSGEGAGSSRRIGKRLP